MAVIYEKDSWQKGSSMQIDKFAGLAECPSFIKNGFGSMQKKFKGDVEAPAFLEKRLLLGGERKTGLEPATYSLGSCRSTR
jgi:hypothetical protein